MTYAENRPAPETQPRVRFGEDEVHIIDADEFDDDSWLDANEMKANFREDVIGFLKEFKRNHIMEAKKGSDDSTSDCSDGSSDSCSNSDEEMKKDKSLYAAEAWNCTSLDK